MRTSKSNLFICWVIFLRLLVPQAQGQHCSASGGCDEYIYEVQVGTINNTATICNNYADYTSSHSTFVEIGTDYTIRVVTAVGGEPYYGYEGDQLGIWVDWNQDGDFYDLNETVYTASGYGLFTTTITPPADAAPGNTRMRVRLMWIGTLGPCGTTDYGEVEDYTITVVPSTVTISGCVKASLGVRIKGVNISASTGETTITDALGYYGLTLPSPFSGTITPNQTDWTFSPSSRTYSSVTTDQVNQDFTATYTVSYAGGSGTNFSPYLIYNAAQLNAVGAKAGDWNKYFRLMADIDLSGYDGKAGRPSFNRIGYYINFVSNFAFTGVFEGGGHTISNFTFDSDAGNDGVGIFGYMTSGAQVKNVKLINIDINSTSNIGTGGLVGMMDDGTVSSCSVQGGTVSSVNNDAGGLVGNMWGGTISGCSVDAVNVSADMWAGGLVGSTYTTVVISDCRASCTVSCKQEGGGLVGEHSGTAIRCSAGGNVSVNYTSILDRTAGGMFGCNSGTVDYCYATATVAGNGGNEIGGLVGRNADGTISNCYASGSATGGSSIGGLVGVCWDSNIVNCYSVGAVNGTGYKGGLIGYEPIGTSHIIGSFWDKQTSGLTTSAGGTGKTTAEMQTEATFLSAGWDFEVETANGDESIWYIRPNNYPRLCWEAGIKYGGGTGEPNNPYLIYTAAQMVKVGANKGDWSKSFRLMADISLAGYGGSAYNIIGRSSSASNGDGPFTGTFDGNYHSISGFSYSKNNISYVGIFGYVGSDGIIKNLKLISPSLTDAGFNDMTYVGPIAGYANGSSISGCTVTGGTVQGKNYVGGLVGLLSGYIASCSSSASVSGNNYIGGLVGGPSSLLVGAGISDCYSRGNVSGNSYVGGFTGNSSDVIIVNCYSTGTISGTSNIGGFSGYNVNTYPLGDNAIGCFWDVESSGEPNSAAGTGLETSAMQDVSTYLDADWDFAGELDNGGSDAWAMPAGGGYPVLWYELPVPPALPTFAGGSGTAEAPYLIETKEQLNSIGHNARLMDKHFKVINDLDLNGLKYYMIAEKPYVFSGTFDGTDHTISNILVEPVFMLSSVGLIGTLRDPGASIRNLTLIDPNIVSDWGWGVGSLVGINQSGTITNCHVVNTHVRGLASVGGLVGNNYLYGSISDCSATGYVSENTFILVIFSAVGGLVGENSFWSEIRESYAKCDVFGEDCVGGLTGSNLIYCTLTNCYAAGSVTGTSDYIGGLVGRNLGGTEVDYCYSSSVVSGPTGTDAVGGFVGKMGTSGKEYYTACFWDSEVNPDVNGIGNGSDPNVMGRPTVEMQTGSSFTDIGWDFVGETANGTDDTWDICEGTNYPKLVWQIPTADFTCPDGVNVFDFAVLASAWLSTPSDDNWNPACDISEQNDDIINVLDLAVFTENWLADI
ncbi:MAG: GLUG motif-containing protein [Planctomycetota bacterium]